MRPGSGLLVLDYAGLGEAYGALQLLKTGSVEVVELIPSAGSTILMLSGLRDELILIEKIFPVPRSRHLIESLPERTIDAWLGLQNPPLEMCLAIFESDSIGAVFEASVRFEQAGIRPFDLRILRGATVKAYVFATGEGEWPNLSDLRGLGTKIQNPSVALKEFFEVSAP